MIRQTHDWLRQRMTAALSRFHISENTFLAILAVIIGVLAGLGNYALRQLIELIHNGVITQGMAHFTIDTDAWEWNRLYLILFPLFGGILMIPLGAYYAKDLRFGFSRFLEEVNLRGGKVPSRTIFTRGLASAIRSASNRLQILMRIIIPLAVPGIVCATLFAFSLAWNDLLYSLVFISPTEKKTLTVGILTELSRGDVYFWGSLMGGALIGSVPVVLFYVVFMDYYVSGMTAGAVK